MIILLMCQMFLFVQFPFQIRFRLKNKNSDQYVYLFVDISKDVFLKMRYILHVGLSDLCLMSV